MDKQISIDPLYIPHCESNDWISLNSDLNGMQQKKCVNIIHLVSLFSFYEFSQVSCIVKGIWLIYFFILFKINIQLYSYWFNYLDGCNFLWINCNNELWVVSKINNQKQNESFRFNFNPSNGRNIDSTWLICLGRKWSYFQIISFNNKWKKKWSNTTQVKWFHDFSDLTRWSVTVSIWQQKYSLNQSLFHYDSCIWCYQLWWAYNMMRTRKFCSLLLLQYNP